VLVELGVVEQRYRAVLEVLEEGLPVTEVARRYGVARQTVHEWLSRYARGAEYARHYNEHRPHQGLRQKAPLQQPGRTVGITARIERKQVIGGLVSEYRRAA
jgi:transposase-like protein